MRMGLFQLDFIDCRTEMEAPVEDVFSFFQQVERWSTWAAGIKRAFRKSDGPWGTGFRFVFVPALFPMPLAVEVTGYEEGRLIEWGIRSSVATVIHRFEFEPMGEDRCSVRQTEFAQGVTAVLMRPMRQKIKDFDQRLATDLQDAIRKGLHRA